MQWLLDKLVAYADKKAIISGESVFTYNDLSGQIQEYFSSLKGKVLPGEVVVLISDYSFHSIAFFLALIQNKNIVIPLTTTLESEIKEKIVTTGFDKSIELRGREYTINQPVEKAKKHDLIASLQNKDRAGLILFSSGSTGKPKAMVHDLDNLLDVYKDKKPKDLNFLIMLMFDHIGGINTLFNALSMGVCLTLPLKREPEHICSLIEKNKIDVLPTTPTFLNLILISEANQKFNLSCLKLITYGTEPMPESLLVRIRQAFPKAKLLQTFGTSETGIAQVSSKSSSSTYIKIDDPNIEYKIENNELWLRSKTQILGYINDSMERFTADGWFKTGDMVEVDKDGYLKIIGRSSEIINVGGLKVLPSEVESVLLRHPDILDCVVYGKQNAITGQAVSADVVLKQKVEPSEARRAIRVFCTQHLDRYKIPLIINLIDHVSFTDRFKKIRKHKPIAH